MIVVRIANSDEFLVQFAFVWPKLKLLVTQTISPRLSSLVTSITSPIKCFIGTRIHTHTSTRTQTRTANQPTIVMHPKSNKHKPIQVFQTSLESAEN